MKGNPRGGREQEEGERGWKAGEPQAHCSEIRAQMHLLGGRGIYLKFYWKKPTPWTDDLAEIQVKKKKNLPFTTKHTM